MVISYLRRSLNHHLTCLGFVPHSSETQLRRSVLTSPGIEMQPHQSFGFLWYLSGITEPTIFDCWWCSNRMADLFYSLRFCLWCSRSKFWKTSIFSAVLWLGSRFTNIDLSRIGWILTLGVRCGRLSALSDPCGVSLYQDSTWYFLLSRLRVEFYRLSPVVVLLVFLACICPIWN